MYWLILVISIVAYSCVELPCADTWWHLAAGREMVEGGGFLRNDPFTFTADTVFWFNHEWLAEIVFYLAYKAGGLWGLFSLRSLLLVLAFGLIPALSHRSRGAAAASAPLVLLVLGQGYYFVDARAYLFTYLFLSLSVLAVRRYLETNQTKWLALGILLMIPWANCHGGYILGPVVWFIAAVAHFSEGKSSWKPLLATCGSAMLVSLANPYGIHIWAFPFSLRQHPLYMLQLNEWQAPQLLGAGFLYLFLPPLAAWLLWRRKAERWEWLLAGGFLFLGFTTWRHGILAGIVLTHLLARELPEMEEGSASRWLVRGSVLGVALILLLNRGQGGPSRWTQERSHFPKATVEYLKSRPELPTRILNPYEWGGYLAWTMGPRTKTFIDGRAHTLFPDQIYLDAMAVKYGAYETDLPDLVSKNAQQVLAEHDIDLAIATKIVGNLAISMQQSPEWAVLYEDDNSAVYLCTRTVTAQRLATKIEDPQLALDYAQALEYSPGEVVMMERAVALAPQQPTPKFGLARALYRQDKLEESKEKFQSLLKENPKFRFVRHFLAEIAIKQSDPQKALQLLDQELELNPNSTSAALRGKVLPQK